MIKRAVLAVAVTVVTAVGVSAGPAQAATTCTKSFQKRVVDGGPDEYRAGVRCTSVDGNAKYRAKLVRTNPFVDITTAWYTDTNVWHYTPWWPYGSSATYEVGTVS